MMFGELWMEQLEQEEREREERERAAKEALDKRFASIDWSRQLTTRQLDSLV